MNFLVQLGERERETGFAFLFLKSQAFCGCHARATNFPQKNEWMGPCGWWLPPIVGVFLVSSCGSHVLEWKNIEEGKRAQLLGAQLIGTRLIGTDLTCM